MIRFIFEYGYANPLYSLIVVGIFIFVTTFIYLRTKAKLYEKLSEVNYYTTSTIRERITECNQAFSATIVFATIPVYFLWLPMLMLLTPMGLAYMMLHYRKIMSLFTTKKVVDSGD